MPYSTNSDLPDSVRNALPSEAQTVFRRVVNQSLENNQSESQAFATAWTAVENGWRKEGDSWVRKSDEFEATNAEVLKVDESLGLIFGWAVISKQDGEEYFDTQGDHIPEDAMLKASAEFMASSRVSKDMHAGDQTGTVVFAWPMTSEIAKAMGIETKNTGLMVAIKPSAEILKKYQDGTYSGFSIGGRRVTDEIAP